MVSTRNKRKNGKDGLFEKTAKSVDFEAGIDEFNKQFNPEYLLRLVKQELYKYLLTKYEIDIQRFESEGVFYQRVKLRHLADERQIKSDDIGINLVSNVLASISNVQENIDRGNIEQALLHSLRLAHEFSHFTVASFEDEICVGILAYQGAAKGIKNKAKEQVIWISHAQELANNIWSINPKLSKTDVSNKILDELNEYLRSEDQKIVTSDTVRRKINKM